MAVIRDQLSTSAAAKEAASPYPSPASRPPSSTLLRSSPQPTSTSPTTTDRNLSHDNSIPESSSSRPAGPSAPPPGITVSHSESTSQSQRQAQPQSSFDSSNPDLASASTSSPLSALLARLRPSSGGMNALPTSARVAHQAMEAAQDLREALDQATAALSFKPRPVRPRLVEKMAHKRATFILLGARGVGKTTLGLIASAALGRKLLDTVSMVESTTGMSKEYYIAEHGAEKFLEQELDALVKCLAQHPSDAVIVCGDSIVDHPRAKQMLFDRRGNMPVIHVVRDRIDAIVSHARAYNLDPTQVGRVWQARDPSYWVTASHIFVNLTQSSFFSDSSPNPSEASVKHPLALKAVERAFLRFIDTITTDENAAAVPPDEHSTTSNGQNGAIATERAQTGIWSRIQPLPTVADARSRESLLHHGRTSYLSLTFPDLRQVDPALFEHVIEGVDAIELRADLLDCLHPASREVREQILREQGELSSGPQVDFAELCIQVEMARALCKTADVPLIFTLRTSREGGKFYDDRDHAAGSMKSPFSEPLYFLLLGIALSMGVEILDLELAWSPKLTRALAYRRGNTRIMCSYHDLVGALRWDSPNAPALYERATSFDPDYVELIGTALEVQQNWHLLSFASKINSAAAADSQKPPLIAINMGQLGQPSRPFHPILSPVSHPALPSVAAPGQLSLQGMTEIAGKLGIIQQRDFVLFATTENVEDESVQSRVLQRAFRRIGLPYTIRFLKESTGSGMLNDFQHNSFGGAFLPGNTYELQGRLFEIVQQERSLFELTEDAVLVGHVDQVCLAELDPTLSRTQGTLNRRDSTASRRCVAHHSLPLAFETCLAGHLNPLNKPGPQSSAVIVVPATAKWHAGLDIGVRSAARAIRRLGFGFCAVLICESGSSIDSKELTGFGQPDHKDNHSEGSGTQFHVISDRALKDLPHALDEAAAKAAVSGPAPKSTTVERHIRSPSALFLVGGTEAQHELALESLLPHAVESALDNSLSESERRGLPLAAEMWNGPLGGVCLSLPTSAGENGKATKSGRLEPTLLKRGWIRVSKDMIEMERLSHGVFEPWTRKRAPLATMKNAYLGLEGDINGWSSPPDSSARAAAAAGNEADEIMEEGGGDSESGNRTGKKRSLGDHDQGAAEALAGMRYG
ncbi:hypothetical protein OC861_004124 [Tilletia horrida]|nr:hypothetical protein OC861_004124 [Tilletia horrida]